MKPSKLLEILAPTTINSNNLVNQFLLVLSWTQNTTSIHVSGENNVDHLSNNYPQDVEGQVGVATARASNDFHVSNVNIDFGLVQEVDVKAQVK
jgi:hypothetical protein